MLISEDSKEDTDTRIKLEDPLNTIVGLYVRLDYLHLTHAQTLRRNHSPAGWFCPENFRCIFP